MNNLRNRGVEDILIAVVDGLKGFPDAINAAFPELQADMAFETYLSAFEEGDHLEVIDSLATEALIAQDRCADLRSQDRAH